MQILILAAGQSGVPDEDPPSLLAEKSGSLIIERLIDRCSSLDANLVFAIRAADARRHNIDSIIGVADPSAVCVQILHETSGAACTALLCVENIAQEDELLIVNANELIDIDYSLPVENFRSRGLDAGVISFRSLHPRYSYIKLDENEHVVEAAEKRPISRNAITGFYWFRRGGDFIQAAMDMIRKDVQIDGKFFISLVSNELILKGKKIGAYEISPASYTPLKSRRQIINYEMDGGIAE